MTFSFISSGKNKIHYFSLKSWILSPRFPLFYELSDSRTPLTFPEVPESFPQSRGLRRKLADSWTWRDQMLACHLPRSGGRGAHPCPRLCLMLWADREGRDVAGGEAGPHMLLSWASGGGGDPDKEPLAGDVEGHSGLRWLGGSTHLKGLTVGRTVRAPLWLHEVSVFPSKAQSSQLGKRWILDTLGTGFESWLCFILAVCPLMMQLSQVSVSLSTEWKGEHTVVRVQLDALVKPQQRNTCDAWSVSHKRLGTRAQSWLCSPFPHLGVQLPSPALQSPEVQIPLLILLGEWWSWWGSYKDEGWNTSYASVFCSFIRVVFDSCLCVLNFACLSLLYTQSWQDWLGPNHRVKPMLRTWHGSHLFLTAVSYW